MKSITIHGLDDYLDRKIKEKAVTEGISINKVIKRALEESFGGSKKVDNKEEFMDLFKTWTQDEQVEFEKVTAEFEKVNQEDWQ